MSFTEFYCNASTGSNLNAGSTESGTATHTYASGTWVQSTRVFTVASGNPESAGVAVGNFASVYPDAATVTPYVGRVSAVSSTTITIDGTAFSGTAPVDGTTNTTIKIGGAWKGPNGAVGFPFGFITGALMNDNFRPRVNLKGGTNYEITATIECNLGQYVSFQGYTTTPGDRGRAIIDGGTTGTSYVLLNISLTAALNTAFIDLTFQNNGATGSATGVNQVSTSSELIFSRVTVHSVRGWGIVFTSQVNAVDVLASGCNQSNTAGLGGIGARSGSFLRLVARDNNRHGIMYGSTTGTATLVNCISTRNTDAGYAYGTNRLNQSLLGCVAYDNGGDGIQAGGGGGQVVNISIENCIAAYNGGRGIDLQASASSASVFFLRDNAVIGNTVENIRVDSGVSGGGFTHNENLITLTADPFVDAENDDFNINNTSGGGAELRAVTVVMP
jgi:hypothetical protein